QRAPQLWACQHAKSEEDRKLQRFRKKQGCEQGRENPAEDAAEREAEVKVRQPGSLGPALIEPGVAQEAGKQECQQPDEGRDNPAVVALPLVGGEGAGD